MSEQVITKVCCRCKADRILTEFNKNQKACRKCQSEYYKEFYSANRYTILKKSAIYSEKNKDRISHRMKRRYLSKKDELNKKYKEYYADNKESLLEKGRKYNNDKRHIRNRWKKINRAKLTSIERNRRARIMQSKGSHSVSDIQWLYQFQSGKCTYCKADLHNKFHVDHKVPLCRGGSNWPWNVHLTCATCNLRKSRKTHDEYISLLSNICDNTKGITKGEPNEKTSIRSTEPSTTIT